MADTSSLLTRCPHCDTRFRVSSEQLGVAGGKVRCGHCLEVFDARSHAVDAAALSSSEASSGTAPSAMAPSEDQGGHDSEPEEQPEHDQEEKSPESFSATEPDEELVFEDNPEEDAAAGRYAGQSLTFSDDELSDTFRDFGEPGSTSDEDEDSDIEDVDESWAEAMLREELPDSPPAPSRSPARPWKPSTTASTGSPTKASTDTPTSQATTTGTTAPPSHDRPRQPDALTATRAELDEPPGEPEYKLETGGHRSASTSETNSSSGFPPLDDLSAYEQLSREPVSVRAHSRSRLRGWFWSLVVLALLAVLVSQVVYFQFDRLAAIPELRGWYEKACNYAGCELEPLVAMDRIRSRKLVVRTDPENRNALLVDAVIVNQAEFEQPFPAIALTFSNLNGDVVAQSIFPPGEYLAGEGVSLDAMPSDTPVRISISIRDPGRDAVNYNLRFVNRRN